MSLSSRNIPKSSQAPEPDASACAQGQELSSRSRVWLPHEHLWLRSR
jgi:hypothetical protein